MRHDRLRTIQKPPNVRVHHGIEVRVCQLHHRNPASPEKSRVIHQNINPPKRRHRRLHHAINRLLIPHIGLNRHRLPSRVPNLINDFPGLLPLCPIIHDDPPSFPREQDGNRAPNAPRTPRHNRDSAFKPLPSGFPHFPFLLTISERSLPFREPIVNIVLTINKRSPFTPRPTPFIFRTPPSSWDQS